MNTSAMATIVADRALAVVRAPKNPDPVALANALAQSRIRALELTFTTPDVLEYLHVAAASRAALGALGPRYFKDLRGPFPDVPLIPSGGVNAGNAADFLAQGAVAVTAGTDVVPPQAVASADWPDISARAASFVQSLN